jgi:hypothetical protein
MARGRKKKDTVEKKKIKKIKIVKSSDGKQPPITTFNECQKCIYDCKMGGIPGMWLQYCPDFKEEIKEE